MKLTFEIQTNEAMSLAEAQELDELSKAKNLSPSELAVDFIRDGLRRLRELQPQLEGSAK